MAENYLAETRKIRDEFENLEKDDNIQPQEIEDAKKIVDKKITDLNTKINEAQVELDRITKLLADGVEKELKTGVVVAQKCKQIRQITWE